MSENDINDLKQQNEKTTFYFKQKGQILAFGNNTIRWLNTVSSTYIWMGRYNHSLSLDGTIMVSKNCSIIGEDAVIIFFSHYRLP